MSKKEKQFWELAPTGDFWFMSISTSEPPCWFHRVMQRCILGFKWRKKVEYNAED